MTNDNMLQQLQQQKRTYESLLALNAAGRHRSSSLEELLEVHLKKVLSAISDLQQQQSHA